MDIDPSPFDLGALANIEETLYTNGYEEGYEHGRIHGTIEGRAIGREKGYQIWEEIGYYEGTALFWKAMCETQGSQKERVMSHISNLLELISQFPTTNPSARNSTTSQMPEDLDIAKLLNQIRTRYKVFCSSAGIRPRLRVADSGSDAPDGEQPAGADAPSRGKAWKFNSVPAAMSDVASGF